MNTVWLALITGITTGGISCFAVQGGLLATAVSNQSKEHQKTSIILFILSKTFAYTILGALLGLAGSSLTLTPKTQGWMQIFAGLIMLLTVARLLDIHPIFRRFVISPPKSFFRFVRNSTKIESYFAPSVFGFSTILIPCGVTQSMIVLAIASASPFWGAMIMLAFTLGTSPLFFTLGIATKSLFTNRKLTTVAAIIIFVLAVSAINTGQILRGSNHTIQNYWLAAVGESETKSGMVAEVNAAGEQLAEIEAITGGYRTTTTTLKSGVPVKLKVSTNNTRGCSRAFTIPQYNISTILPETGEEIIEFTPRKKGRLTFSCSMGMYTGYFDVI